MMTSLTNLDVWGEVGVPLPGLAGVGDCAAPCPDLASPALPGAEPEPGRCMGCHGVIVEVLGGPWVLDGGVFCSEGCDGRGVSAADGWVGADVGRWGGCGESGEGGEVH